MGSLFKPGPTVQSFSAHIVLLPRRVTRTFKGDIKLFQLETPSFFRIELCWGWLVVKWLKHSTINHKIEYFLSLLLYHKKQVGIFLKEKRLHNILQRGCKAVSPRVLVRISICQLLLPVTSLASVHILALE